MSPSQDVGLRFDAAGVRADEDGPALVLVALEVVETREGGRVEIEVDAAVGHLARSEPDSRVDAGSQHAPAMVPQQRIPALERAARHGRHDLGEHEASVGEEVHARIAEA